MQRRRGRSSRCWNLLPAVFFLCVAIFSPFFSTGVASACPMCQAALASHDASHGDLVSAYMWSILFLMAMPFTLLTGFSGYMYLLVRRARAQGAVAGTASGESKAPATARSPVE